VKFNYQARTKEGDVQAGVVEAASQEVAVKVLQEYGLVVTFLEQAGEEPFYSKSLGIFQRIGRKDLVLFSRELSAMFKSEVSLVESLRAIAEETKNPTFKEKILKLGETVEAGTSFSAALAGFPELFSDFYINLVKSGEVSGQLSDVLEYLADHLEREYDLLRKISGMMIYPAFVLVVFTGVLLAMSLLVMPKMISMLETESQSLPLITKIVIGFTEFLRKYIILIGAGLVFLVILFKRYSQTEIGKKNIDNFWLKFPLVGRLLKMIYLTRLAENLSTLISGGLPIAEALEIVAKVVGNSRYQDIILETREEVRRGETISYVLKKYPEFVSAFFSQMVLVGEKTGRLSEILLNIVRFYQKEVEGSMENLLSLLEPLMIIILGGAVGILIAAVLLPIYQIGTGPM
jgi:type IV pilus assembly protein PilC